ncbi:MAG: N-acetylmuramoyl-L-alanine amidase [Phycisphaerae bacterium]
MSVRLRANLTRRFLGPLLVAALAMVAVGCGEQPGLQTYDHETISAPRGSVSVYQLAGWLGLKVASVDRASVTLRDPANIVLLLSDPGGQVYVNGRPIGDIGGLVFVEETLFVPRTLYGPIKQSLRPVPEIALEDTRRGIGERPERDAEQPRKSPIHGVVLLDPGHGGRDGGATAVNGVREKWVNLAVAKRVGRLLEGQGVTVLMTRDDDSAVSLQRRAETANQKRPDLLVSLHADWFRKSSVKGYNVYMATVAGGAAHRAALRMSNAMTAAGIEEHGDPVRRAKFYVLMRTACPAILVEMGFLSHRSEGSRLTTSAYQKTLAQAIAAGILAHLEAEKK